MNYTDWYTDTVDIWRTVPESSGNLTVNIRKKIYENIPCRIYRSEDKAIGMDRTASNIVQEDKLACDNDVDIRTGDELRIHRGGRIGKKVSESRAFAGEPNYYFEPFGAVIPGIAHQEIRLLHQERVK